MNPHYSQCQLRPGSQPTSTRSAHTIDETNNTWSSSLPATRATASPLAHHFRRQRHRHHRRQQPRPRPCRQLVWKRRRFRHLHRCWRRHRASPSSPSLSTPSTTSPPRQIPRQPPTKTPKSPSPCKLPTSRTTPSTTSSPNSPPTAPLPNCRRHHPGSTNLCPRHPQPRLPSPIPAAS